jgi:hypothetical protein
MSCGRAEPEIPPNPPFSKGGSRVSGGGILPFSTTQVGLLYIVERLGHPALDRAIDRAVFDQPNLGPPPSAPAENLEQSLAQYQQSPLAQYQQSPSEII